MLEKLINDALNKDVDLTEEEYKEKMKKADEITEKHGVSGNAPLSESKRHKRIEMNYYGLSINYLANLLGEMTVITNLLQTQNAMLKELLKEKGIDVNERRT